MTAIGPKEYRTRWPAGHGGGVAAVRVIGAVRRHSADLFAFGDLVKQLRQHKAVTIAAGGKFHGADIRRGCTRLRKRFVDPSGHVTDCKHV